MKISGKNWEGCEQVKGLEDQWEEAEGLSAVHFRKMVLTTMWTTPSQAGMNEGRKARDKVFAHGW